MSAASYVANLLLTNRQKKWIKIRRAGLFEALGSDRYSRPALNDMESALAPFLPHDGGVFIECGANDGYAQSNTYYLSRFRNWRGVLIEPIPALWEICKKIRPEAHVLNCALGATDGGSVTLIYSDLMSTTTDGFASEQDALAFAGSNRSYVRHEGHYKIEMPLRTISSILDELAIPQVDLFSLDVEGYELEVLRGLDAERHLIDLILVETQKPDAVAELLAPSHRLEKKVTHHDYLFQRL